MNKSALLGEISFVKKKFDKEIWEIFQTKEFGSLNLNQKNDAVNRRLLEWIEKEPAPCFLLAPVLAFIERVETEKLLPVYRFFHFEQWLNQQSGLSDEANRSIRGKIVGKYIDRSSYQALFPIGMGKMYEGTHFVTAHKSPDLDTTIASFWGWMDSFGAQISNGMHVWNVPGGPPSSQIEIDWIFKDLFGPAVFTHLAQNRLVLGLTGLDLMTQKGMVQTSLSEPVSSIDHERDQNAVVLVDAEGLYLGDWRNVDIEPVRQIINLFSSCIRWFENNLHVQLIGLFAKEKLFLKDIEPFLKSLFGMKVVDCEPALEFSPKQKAHIETFLVRVLHMKKGLDMSFEEFGVHVAKIGSVAFEGVDRMLASMQRAQLFSVDGSLIEERPRLFTYLEKAVASLHDAILKIRARLEKLDIALKTKYEVFSRTPTCVSWRADVEEIREKIGVYSHLTVVYEDEGRSYPIGVIHASDVRKATLGTVSLRDFCNRNEMGIPAYLEVLSVIDHHKSQLNTSAPLFAIISDAQSSNSLVAQQAFIINDRYSLAGQSQESIDAQITVLSKTRTPESIRLLQRLLQRKMVGNAPFYVHPEREFIEYLHFLYGILDDTDLLSKVSATDVECVASLLNRMKTIATGRETEVISLDDLPRDRQFAKKAASRILRNEEMYSLYRKVYAYREREVESNMLLAAEGKPSNIFADTKEQNGCCRVGQTKIFVNNLPALERHMDAIRMAWLQKAGQVYRDKVEIDLHMHMLSTIVSADEVYRGTQGVYDHTDEMWIWIPFTDTSLEHLKRFLNAFQNAPGLQKHLIEVEFVGDKANVLASVFNESFFQLKQKQSQGKESLIILRYKPSTLNSRKAMVSPFLPA